MYDNPPALSNTGYNSCQSIIYNYSTYQGYEVGVERAKQTEFDTIKVCGYFLVHIDPDRTWYTFSDAKLSESSSENTLDIFYCQGLDSTEIFTEKKYYLTAVLSYRYKSHGDNEGACAKFIPQIGKIVDYYYE